MNNTIQSSPKTATPFDEKQMSMWVHLATFADMIIPFSSFVVKIILWRTNLGKSSFFETQAKEAINFEISMWLFALISFLLIFVLIGIPLIIGLIIVSLVFPLIAAVKSHNGEDYRYPLTIRFIK